jgi:beta-lactamase regulating signal transducer with metallopeptidase domain
MTPVAIVLLKVTLLLVAAFVAHAMLRTASAARRYRVWGTMFVAILALPLLGVVPLPPLDMPMLSASAEHYVSSNALRRTESGLSAAPSGKSSPAILIEAKALVLESPIIRLPSLRTALAGTWLLGSIVAAVAILVSYARVRRLVRSGVELNDETWRAAFARIASRLGYHHTVRIISCDGIRAPMAGGLLRAIVFVPADALQWDEQRRDIVLAHEIAHLANGDQRRYLVSRLACALYWFHPLVWLALRESTADCEQACDERVLSLGVRPSIYADLLLDFAAGPVLNPDVAVTMVRRFRLEQRIMSILENRPRPAVQCRLRPAMVAVGLTVSLAAARPVTRTPQIAVSESSAAAKPAAVAPPVAPVAVVAPRVIAQRTVVPAPITPVVTAAYQEPPMQAVAPECWGAEDRSRSFNGTMSTNGGTILEQIGRRGRERVIQRSFRSGELRVCMVTTGFNGASDDRPSQWPQHSDRVILETRMPNDVRAMYVDNGRATYIVNGAAQPLDAAAREWRDNLLELLDPTWDHAQLRGRMSSLQRSDLGVPRPCQLDDRRDLLVARPGELHAERDFRPSPDPRQ